MSATLTLAAALILPGALSTLRHHPHTLGSYGELVGGVRGAANLGMERQFWGGASRQLLAHVNAEAKKGAKVFWDRTNETAGKAYKRTGALREDLRFVGSVHGADWMLAFHQPDSDWVHSAIRERGAELVAVEGLEGVPMVSLYRSERRKP